MSDTVDLPLTLDLERRFSVSPERVFEAWISEAWCKWLPPAQSTCRILEQNPVEGGHFHVEMTMPDSRMIEVRGTYKEVTRYSRLAMTWTGSYNDHELAITVSFQPDGTGTMMTLHQEGFVDPDLREGYREGWSGPGGSFDKLAQLLGG